MRKALLSILLFSLSSLIFVATPIEAGKDSCDRLDKIKVHIRWMIRRDMPEVLATERAAFEFPWSEDDFIRCLRQRNAIGMVAEVDDRVVGYMIYELHKTRIHLLNFAVSADARRSRVGEQMMAKLISKLSSQKRSRITLEVRETNLAAQQFFKANGFRAVSVMRGFYDEYDTPEDAYLMQYRYRPNDPRNDPREADAIEEQFGRVTRLAAEGPAEDARAAARANQRLEEKHAEVDRVIEDAEAGRTPPDITRKLEQREEELNQMPPPPQEQPVTPEIKEERVDNAAKGNWYLDLIKAWRWGRRDAG